MPNVISFLSFVFLTLFTPGPSNIMTMTNASRDGFKKTLGFAVGIGCGFMVLVVTAMTFSSTLLKVLPQVEPYLKGVGATYILWLAYKTLHSNYNVDGTTSNLNSFTSGFMLQFVNPKAILFCITVTSNFIAPYYHDVVALGMFALFLAVIMFIAVLCWAAFGSVFERFLHSYTKGVNIIMAALLIYCAVSLFL